jgi:hypothetical protein
MLDQVRGSFHHPARSARGTKSPLATTERHQVFVAAAAALDAEESVFEPPAAQVRFELLAHEPGQRGVAFGEMLKERLGVLLDSLVEQRFLRASWYGTSSEHSSTGTSS